MSKYKQSEKRDNESVGDSVETYKQSESLYDVIVKQDSKMEVTVQGECLLFHPHVTNPIHPEKYKNGLPEKIINSDAFKSVEMYFNIRKRG